jgi:hypothetical protein
VLATSSTSPQSCRTSKRSRSVSGGRPRTCRAHALLEQAWRPTTIKRWTPAQITLLQPVGNEERELELACQKGFRRASPASTATFSTLSVKTRNHQNEQMSSADLEIGHSPDEGLLSVHQRAQKPLSHRSVAASEASDLPPPAPCDRKPADKSTPGGFLRGGGGKPPGAGAAREDAAHRKDVGRNRFIAPLGEADGSRRLATPWAQ